MMHSKMLPFSVLAAMLCIPQAAMATSKVGNGAGLVSPQAASAWFVEGAREIRYCIKASPYFAMNFDLDREIEKSFDTWVAYLNRKKIDAQNPKRLRFARQLKKVLRCDYPHDIRFMFGVKDEEVEKQFEFFDSAIGLSLAEGRQSGEPWRKGVIWVSEPTTLRFEAYEKSVFIDWQASPHYLPTILLHEWGHVFGNRHVKGTIMAENIVEIMLLPQLLDNHFDGGSQEQWNYALVTIDHFSQLAMDRLTDRRRYQGFVPSEVLEYLTGSKVEKSSHATLESGKKGELDLLIHAPRHSERLSLEIISTSIMNRVASFVRFIDARTVIPALSGAQVHYGMMRDSTGREHQIALEQNSQSTAPSPIKLFLLCRGHRIPIFVADNIWVRRQTLKVDGIGHCPVGS